MKITGILLAAVSAVACALPAQAAVFTITGGATPFSFTIKDGTVPDLTYGNGKIQYFDVPASGTSSLMTINFYDPGNFSRLSLEIENQDLGNTPYTLYGAKLFSGDLDAPTFSPATYQLNTRRNGNGTAYTLTISADAAAPVPEPDSWMMMIGGFGLMGGALRRHRTIKASFAIG